MRPADRRKRRASRHERTRAQRAATAGRLASLGSNFAVLDDVRAWAAAAGVVVAAGWEERAAGRRRLRVVAVDDVITGAAGDRVTAEISEQRVVVRAAGDHVIERAAEGSVVARAARDGVDAAHPDQRRTAARPARLRPGHSRRLAAAGCLAGAHPAGPARGPEAPGPADPGSGPGRPGRRGGLCRRDLRDWAAARCWPPVMIGLGRRPSEVAPAALAATFVTSVVGVLSFTILSAHGPGAAAPDWPTGIALGLGGLAGGYTGARLQSRLPDAMIRRLVGVVILGIGIFYLWSGLA